MVYKFIMIMDAERPKRCGDKQCMKNSETVRYLIEAFAFELCTYTYLTAMPGPTQLDSRPSLGWFLSSNLIFIFQLILWCL